MTPPRFPSGTCVLMWDERSDGNATIMTGREERRLDWRTFLERGAFLDFGCVIKARI